MSRVQHSGIPALAALAAILCFSSGALASGVVTNATESSLVAAMASGGTVTFGVSGTIYLTNTIVVSNNTVLDATGQSVAISGSNAVQIFIISSNATVSMTNLTLENGLYEIANVFCYGGAVSNGGTLQMTGCTFASNSVVALGEPYEYPGPVSGGAIYNTGIFAAQGCIFIGNAATGGFGGPTNGIPGFPGGLATGGAVYNANQAILINCVFSNNTATGGVSGSWGELDPNNGLTGGMANGGAICNNGSLLASNNTFALNVSAGGQGGEGGYEYPGPYQTPGGNGGAGGTADGGGICCLGGSCVLVNDTFWSNSAVGGVGGAGGSGEAPTQHYGVGGNGGNGGQGGNGSGGALSIQAGSLLALNVTVASNSIAGGIGGAGGLGGTEAVFYDPTPGAAGAVGSPGLGEGESIGNLGGAVTLKNSILAANAPSDTNIFGSIIDAGYNIDSDSQKSLTNSTSLNGVNPDLAPVGNYGGPTPTMALLPGSPAIDAADPADFPATDQRGVPRPFGKAPDIGAFEYTTSVIISGQITGLMSTDQATVTAGQVSALTTSHGAYSILDIGSLSISASNTNYVFVPPSQTISLASNQTAVNFQAYRLNAITLGAPSTNAFNLAFAGTNGQQFRIETSTNFTGWTPIATNIIGAAGYLNISLPLSNTGSHFYRLVSP